MRHHAATVPDLDNLEDDSEHRADLISHACSAPCLSARADMLAEFRAARYHQVPKAFGGFEAGKTRARAMTMELVDVKQSLVDFDAEDLEKDARALESRATPALYICIVTSATSSFLWGYHTAVMSPAEETALPNHSLASWSAVVTAMVIGAILGSLLGDRLAEIHGRRQTVLITCVANLLGGVGLLVAGASVMIACGARVLVGIAAGLTMCVVPVYIGEISPVELRASLNGVPQFMNCMGILTAELLGLLNMDAVGLFGVSVAISGLQLFVVVAFPLAPSPEYLVWHPRKSRTAGQESLSQSTSEKPAHDEAIAVCKRLYGYDDAEAIHHIEVMERVCKAGPDTDTASSAGLFSDTGFAMMAASVVILNIAQQFSGFNAILQYSALFFKPLFDNPNMPAVMVGVANLAGSMGTMKLMQHTRRKVLLAISLSGMLLAMLIVTLGSGMLLVAAVVAFAISFQVGLGPLPGCLASEMYDTSRRSSAQSLGAVMNNLANCAVTFCFPLVYRSLQNFTFVIFGTVLAFALLFVTLVLPETLHKHPEEIHTELNAATTRLTHAGMQVLQESFCEELGMSQSKVVPQISRGSE